MEDDFSILAEVASASSYKTAFEKKALLWKGSPFEYVHSLTSRQKGAFGEKLLSDYFIAKGHHVEKPKGKDYDRLINGYKCEIKMSTLWSGGHYAFQQIRHGDWDYLLCLGLSPHAAHFYYAQRDILGYLSGQHTGARGTDTKWMHIRPDVGASQQQKLSGGSLSDGVKSFLADCKKTQ